MSTIKVSTIDTPTSSDFAVKTASATRLTILESGNIGVRTASPLAPLHVSDLSAEIRITAPSITGADWSILPQTNNTTPLFRVFDRYNSLDRLTIMNNGNVGIGTTTPTVALDVVGEARSSTSTIAGSNAKTLVTKDYVDTGINGTRIGTTIVFSGITYQTAYSRFGITHSATSGGAQGYLTLPTGTWNGFVIKDQAGGNVVVITHIIDGSGTIAINNWDASNESVAGVITRTA